MDVAHHGFFDGLSQTETAETAVSAAAGVLINYLYGETSMAMGGIQTCLVFVRDNPIYKWIMIWG